jgi:peptidase M23-like protein
MKYLLAILASLIGATWAPAAEIHSVLAHPVFGEGYACVEHGADSLKWDLGDALGTDCFIRKLVEADGRALPRFYRGNGTQNEDWYGWQQDVLSPCTCKVIELHVNLLTNSPGVMGKEPASIVKLKRADGVVFVVVHFDKPRVKVGETIAGGQVIGQVGNNGLSEHPHIHIGAYKGSEPLQVRFDQHFIRSTLSVSSETAD